MIEVRILSGQADESDRYELVRLRGELDNLTKRDRQQASQELGQVWEAYDLRGGPEAMRQRQTNLEASIKQVLSELAENSGLWRNDTVITAADRRDLMVGYAYDEPDARESLKQLVADGAVFGPKILDLRGMVRHWDKIEDRLKKTLPANETREPVEESSRDAKIDTLSDELQLRTKKIIDSDSLWVRGTSSEDRSEMLMARVLNFEDYTEAEVAQALTEKGKKILFAEAAALRKLSDEMNRLVEERYLDENPVAAEAEPVVESRPIKPESTALVAIATDKDRAHAKDEARRKLHLEAQAIALEALADAPTESASSEVLNSARAEMKVRDVERTHDALAAAREAMYGSDSADQPPRPPEDLSLAADAPPVPPEDAPQVEALPDMAGLKGLATDVEALVAGGMIEEAQVLLNDMLETLDLEATRLNAMEKTRGNKLERVGIEARIRDGRRQRQNLLRRLRATLRDVNGHAADTEAPVIAKAEKADYAARLELEAKLMDSVLDINQARKLLRDDVPQVAPIQELMGHAETKLSVIRAGLAAYRVAGGDGALLEAHVDAVQGDLRRLQENAKKVISELMREAVAPVEAAAEIKAESSAEKLLERVKTRAKAKPSVPVRAEPVPELGVPVAEVVAATEPKSVFGRARETFGNALNYIRTGWKRVIDEEVLGELAPHELDRMIKIGGVEKSLQVTAGILGGLSSTLGTAFFADAGRWVTQNVAATPERAALKQAVAEAVRARRQLSGIDRPEGETATARTERQLTEHAARRDVLVEKVNASRRLTPEAKQALLTKLEAALGTFKTESESIESDFQHEIDIGIHARLDRAQKDAIRILDTHIGSKIGGGKVLREGVNTAMAAGSVAALFTGAGTVFAGAHFVRGPLYSAQAFLDRYGKTSQEFARGERKSDASVLDVMKEGFVDWSTKLFGKGKNIKDRRQALATLVRFTGLGATSALAGGALLVEGATDIDFDEILDRAFEQVSVYAKQAYGAITGPETVSMMPSAGDVIRANVPEIAPVDMIPVFSGEIPVGSRIEAILDSGLAQVSEKEGITFPLRRVIESDPEAYGYDPEATGLSPSMWAKKMAMEITNRDKQMSSWLTDKAINKLNLFPEQVDGEWHIAGVVDGKRLSVGDLAKQGFTSSVPAPSKLNS
jgi:hypothetical protein